MSRPALIGQILHMSTDTTGLLPVPVVLLRLVYRRAYALCGGAHPGLGQHSPLRAVPQPVLRHILEFFLPF